MYKANNHLLNHQKKRKTTSQRIRVITGIKAEITRRRENLREASLHKVN